MKNELKITDNIRISRICKNDYLCKNLIWRKVLETIVEEEVVDCIVEGIQEKRGKEIVSIDLSALENTICRHFIICHGDSNTQVSAIAQWVERIMEEKHNEKVRRKQGFENAQWILLDYFDVVVHIFQKEFRDFYNLENLWADGKVERHGNKYFN